MVSRLPSSKLASRFEHFIVYKKEHQEFDCTQFHPDLAGYVGHWESRPLVDLVAGLEIGGHHVQARELVAHAQASVMRFLKQHGYTTIISQFSLGPSSIFLVTAAALSLREARFC